MKILYLKLTSTLSYSSSSLDLIIKLYRGTRSSCLKKFPRSFNTYRTSTFQGTNTQGTNTDTHSFTVTTPMFLIFLQDKLNTKPKIGRLLQYKMTPQIYVHKTLLPLNHKHLHNKLHNFRLNLHCFLDSVHNSLHISQFSTTRTFKYEHCTTCYSNSISTKHTSYNTIYSSSNPDVQPSTFAINKFRTNPEAHPTTSRTLSDLPLPVIPNNTLSYTLLSTNANNILTHQHLIHNLLLFK